MNTFRLDLDLVWIEVKGVDAGKFLNSVLTNDIRKLSGPAGSYNLLLTPKGKILADCLCYACGEWFGLTCEKRHKETILNTLKRYILFGQKVELKDESEKWKALGLIGPDAHTVGEGLKEKDVYVIVTQRWGRPYAEVWARTQNFPNIKERLTLPPLDDETAEAWRIESGTPAFGKDFDENTIPQEACLFNALSFDKGCYVGQEIVARLEHRGHVGKQLVKLVPQDKNTPPPSPGEKIFSSLAAEPKEIGWITSSCPTAAIGYLRHQFLQEKNVLVQGKQMFAQNLVKDKVS